MKKKYFEPLMKVQSIDLKNNVLLPMSETPVEGEFDVKEQTLEW